MKSVLCQKYFLEEIQSNTNAYILNLDTNTGELDSLCMMISKLTLNKYPNLPLLLLVDKNFWSSYGYHFKFMSHMEDEEATMIMHNLIPTIIFKYGYNVKTYFLPEAVEAAKYEYWKEKLKIVMCKTDENISEAEKSDTIGINIYLEFSKNTRNNFLPPQNKTNPATHHTRP